LRGFIIGSLLGGAGGLVIGILIGMALISAFGYLQSGGVNIPYNLQHIGIANEVNVKVGGKSCVVHHILTTTSSFVPQDVKVDVKNLLEFSLAGQLTQSLWTFTQDNNVQVSMTIIGPPENTSTYLLEFGRLTFQDVDISGFDFSISWITGQSEGYALRDITFP